MCYSNAEEPKPQARFSFYWALDGEEPIAFYAVRLPNGVTHWSGQTLLDNEIPLPVTPTYSTWEAAVYSLKNCGRCWCVLDGTPETAELHRQKAHGEVKCFQSLKVA